MGYRGDGGYFSYRITVFFMRVRSLCEFALFGALIFFIYAGYSTP